MDSVNPEELYLTPHECRVRRLNRVFGNPCPSSPQVPTKAEFLRQFRIIFEEVLELARSGGIAIRPYAMSRLNNLDDYDFIIDAPNSPAIDLVEAMDAVADISVTNTGMAALCGVALTPILEAVDSNNLAKLAGGHRDPTSGKWIKPANHPKPPIELLLKMQGWEGPSQ